MEQRTSNGISSTSSSSIDLRGIVLRLFVLLATGALTGAAVLQELTPVVLFLAGSGGGIVASWLYERASWSVWLSSWVLAYWDGNVVQRSLARAVEFLFFDKRTAATVVFALSTLLSGVATAALTYLSGQPLSAAWTALLAFAASQVLYMWNKAHPPVDQPPRG